MHNFIAEGDYDFHRHVHKEMNHTRYSTPFQGKGNSDISRGGKDLLS